jgi:nickel transport protein
MLRGISLAVAVVGALTTGAYGHGVWTAQRHGDLAIVYGHGAGDEAYGPEKVRKAVSHLPSGETRDSKVLPQAKNALVEPAPGAVALTVVFDNGVWTKGADGKSVNRPKREVNGAQSASHSVKINTTVLKEGAALKPTGQGLEIVPLVDPMGLKMGDDLPVQVFADGKPLPGVPLYPDYVNDGHAQSGKTDQDGKVVLFVRNDGLNVIGVSHAKKTPDNAEIDQVGYFATLSFALPHADD